MVYGGLSLKVPFSYDPLGPSAFPIGIGAVMAFLSLFVIAKPSQKAVFPPLNTTLKTLLIVVLLFLYQLFFDVFGFLAATFCLVFAIARLFQGTPSQSLGAGVGVSTVVYVLFKFLLEVPLPMGTLFSKVIGA